MVIDNKMKIKTALGFGVFVGVLFSLFSWGVDGLILSGSHAISPWTKLIIGAPLTIALTTIVSVTSSYSRSTGMMMLIWAGTGWLIGLLSGHIPFDGINASHWFMDKAIWGEPTYSFGYAANVRTILVTVINIFLFSMIGLMESFVFEWAWDRSNSGKKLSFMSWVTIFLGALPALLPGLAANYFINQPLRVPQVTVSKYIDMFVNKGPADTRSKEMAYRSLSFFEDRIKKEYTTHFIGFSTYTENWFSATIDVEFSPDNRLRCSTAGENLVYCEDMFEDYIGWMGELVGYGMHGEQTWLNARIRKFEVPERVLTWLDSNHERLQTKFTLIFNKQIGSWVILSAKFDNGFIMQCRFKGASPVIVDHCSQIP